MRKRLQIAPGRQPLVAFWLATVALGMVGFLPLPWRLGGGQALARAGGGEGFHAPAGDDRDSSSAGGNGGTELIYDLIFLTFRHPGLGIPVDVVVVAVAFYLYRQKPGRGGGVWASPDLHDYRPPRRHDQTRDGLAALQEHDPGFQVAAFTPRVAQAFVAIQTEWSERRLDRVKALTTDGVRERFQILLDLERERGIANLTKDVRVDDVRIVDVQSDQTYDTVQVCIHATAIDYHVKAGTDELVYGSRQPEAFTEYWSFLRRRSGVTKPGPGLMEGHCPSCGAPLDLTDRGACGYCQTVVNTGTYDWVLAEITQASVADGKGRQVAGLEELVARDPGFNTQYVEDRVSVMFWRLRLAEAKGTAKPLAQIAAPAFLKERQPRLEARDGQGRHEFVGDAAVGAIDLVAAEPGAGGTAPARLHVRVKWSGRPLTASLPALIPPDYDQCHVFDEEYVLVRDAAARTPAGQELRAGRCPSCGAPQSADAGANCASCGTPLNAAERDWLLEAVQPYRGVALAKSGVSPAADRRVLLPEAEHLIGACVWTLARDGRLADDDWRLIAAFARRRELVDERTVAIARSVAAGRMPEAKLASTGERRAFLQTMVRTIVADGVTADEEALLERLAPRLPAGDYDPRVALAAARSEARAG